MAKNRKGRRSRKGGNSRGGTVVLKETSCPQFTAAAALGYHNMSPGQGSSKAQALGSVFEEYRCLSVSMRFVGSSTNDGLEDATTPIGFAGMWVLGYYPVLPASAPANFADVLSAPYSSVGLGTVGAPWPRLNLGRKVMAKGLRPWYATNGSGSVTGIDMVQGVFYCTTSAGLGFNSSTMYMIQETVWEFRSPRASASFDLRRNPSEQKTDVVPLGVAMPADDDMVLVPRSLVARLKA